ncbi:mycothiol system anti-sigma-R factor [Nocardia sp. SYP-A9097]|uniref:mycothiol system anti-sigma-R factor n=1 Tax=Nocardia sp. SYP-A9097 TaxID=2663237 RepID=UPI00129B65E0|nr:mycothiol system anti-sigma-R factor [Nocardia sp. SYP-A9097]MRH87810.1 mycothiol system anti-sigma-R factor [Nocardia sp. SYP-A9097]
MDMDCTAVLADVWLLLDNECDETIKARLREHINRCSPCIEAYGLEEKLKSLLNRKCGGERAPDSLRARLTMEIRTTFTQVETSIEPQ